MKADDLLRKLTSRKFWLAVSGFVTAILTANNATPDSITHIVGSISALGVVVAYLFAEGIADSGRRGSEDE